VGGWQGVQVADCFVPSGLLMLHAGRKYKHM
jgi:hypothetical protein